MTLLFWMSWVLIKTSSLLMAWLKSKRSSVVTPFKSNNFSVWAATNSERLLAFQIFKGSIQSEDFYGYFANLIPSLAEKMRDYDISLLENWSIRQSKYFQSQLRRNKAISNNALYFPVQKSKKSLLSGEIWWRIFAWKRKRLSTKNCKNWKTCPNNNKFRLKHYFHHLMKMMECFSFEKVSDESSKIMYERRSIWTWDISREFFVSSLVLNIW